MFSTAKFCACLQGHGKTCPRKIGAGAAGEMDGWTVRKTVKRAKREKDSDEQDVRDIEFEDKSLVSQAGSLVRWLNLWEKTLKTLTYIFFAIWLT